MGFLTVLKLLQNLFRKLSETSWFHDIPEWVLLIVVVVLSVIITNWLERFRD